MKDKPLWIGFHRIDAAIGGLQQGQITIISSDDEIALKALEYSIIRNVGVEQNRSAALFTLTSTKEEASLHLLSSTSKINRENLSSGFISEKDWVTLTRAAGELSDASIFIDDSPAIATKEMFQKCFKLIITPAIEYVNFMRHKQPLDA